MYSDGTNIMCGSLITIWCMLGGGFYILFLKLSQVYFLTSTQYLKYGKYTINFF